MWSICRFYGLHNSHKPGRSFSASVAILTRDPAGRPTLVNFTTMMIDVMFTSNRSIAWLPVSWRCQLHNGLYLIGSWSQWSIPLPYVAWSEIPSHAFGYFISDIYHIATKFGTYVELCHRRICHQRPAYYNRLLKFEGKFIFFVIPCLTITSQQNCAHGTETQLPCHVYNCVAIALLELGLKQNKIVIEFVLWWKYRQWQHKKYR